MLLPGYWLWLMETCPMDPSQRQQPSKKAKGREQNSVPKPGEGAVPCPERPGEDGEGWRKVWGHWRLVPAQSRRLVILL